MFIFKTPIRFIDKRDKYDAIEINGTTLETIEYFAYFSRTSKFNYDISILAE